MLLKSLLRMTVVTTLLLILGTDVLAADRPPRKYALVVGVHEDREGQPLPALPYAEPDAEQLGDVLKRGGYTVTVMTQSLGGKKGQYDQLPLASNLRDKLTGILGNPFLKEQDTVILALAGHGVLLRVREDEKVVERFFFCPMDADVAPLIKAAQNGTFLPLDDVREKHHLLSLDELYERLGNSCKAGLKLLLVDACRNDPSRETGQRAIESLTLPSLAPPPGGVAAYFSCSAHQKAQEDPELKHGVFFRYVIEGLGGKADFSKDETVTLAELNEYVGTNVYDFVYRKYKSRQVPELKGALRGRAELLPLPSVEEARLVTNSIAMKLVRIPAGEFLMGSPESEDGRFESEFQHRVRITKAFYLGQTEVTQAQWQAVMRTRPWKGQEYVKEGLDYPATYVSWEEATEFCRKLTVQERQVIIGTPRRATPPAPLRARTG